MAYSDKAKMTTWPHDPTVGGTVTAGTTSPKVGWKGNLEHLKEWLDWLHDALLGTGGHTHTGADGDGTKIPTDGLADLAVSTAKIAATAVTSAKVDSTVTTNAFKTISVSGQDDVVADAAADTLTLAAGTGITITTTAASDTVTITYSGTDPDKVDRRGHNYTIPGEIKVASGDTDYILPFYVSLATGQTASLVKARHRINSGTSATCKLTKNGSDITGFTGISVTTSSTDTDPDDVALADNDLIALVVTAVSGTPKNMSFGIFIEYTQ